MAISPGHNFLFFLRLFPLTDSTIKSGAGSIAVWEILSEKR